MRVKHWWILLFLFAAFPQKDSLAFDYRCVINFFRPSGRVLSTIEKAREFNNGINAMGTFSEIGASQKVVEAFFDARNAKNTVAKSISPYSKEVSSALYGACTPFVCEKRLHQQLDHEFVELTETMKTRPAEERHFVFADTAGTDRKGGHAWLGLKFQTQPGRTPSEVLIHAKLNGKKTIGQQADLGTLGVNLVHGSYTRFENKEAWVQGLFDNLKSKNVQVDSLRISGPTITAEDNLKVAFAALKTRFASDLVFNPSGEMVAPSAAFYNKPLLAVPSNSSGLQQRIEESSARLATAASSGPTVVMRVISLKDLKTGGKLDFEKFSRAVSRGEWVLLTDSPDPRSVSGFLQTIPSKHVEYVHK